jgi:two-component system, cell cycle sensor histidine kinase and response regulator CckA
MMTDQIKDDILREQIRLAMRQLPTMQATSFIVALALSYVVRTTVSHTNILVWILMVLSIVMGRVLFWFKFRKVSEGPFDGDYWRKLYLLLALVSGIFWGLSAFIIFPSGNPGLICLFVLVIASLSAATTISHSSIRFGPTVWVGPAMLSYAIRCFIEGGEFGQTVGFLIVLYLFTIIRYSFNHNRSITSAIALTFQNLALLEKTQKVNDILRQGITVRKQAELALLESEEPLRLALEAAKAGRWVWDLKSSEMFWSQEVWKLYGLEPQSVKPSYEVWVKTILPEDREMAEQTIREGVQKGRELNVEWRVCDPDGTERWLMLRGAPMRDETGQTVRYSGIVMDVTDRKRAEEELRRYELLFGHSRDIILFVHRDDGHILEANTAAANAYGYSREELMTLSIHHLRPLDTLGQIADQISEADTHGILFETVHVRKDGSMFPVEVSSRGATVGGTRTLLSVIRDISERKRAEEALRESEGLYRSFFENSLDAIFITDPAEAGRIHAANPPACRMFGYTEEELCNLSRGALVDPSDVGVQRLLEDRTRTGKGWGELVHVRKDGSSFPTEVSSSVFKDKNGRDLCITIIRDISERKLAEEERMQLEQRLQQVQKTESLGRMAGAIAHHFNNLLMAVMGNLELALYGLPPESRAQANITGAMTASQRAARISRLMLTYAGQTGGKKVSLDLSEAIREGLLLLSVSLPKKVHLRTELPDPGPIILADASHIEQILTNLALNAGEAIGEQEGEITVVVDVVAPAEIQKSSVFPPDWDPKAESYACLLISDTGCGMDTATLETIFDPFFSTKFTGRGMGLSVVLGLVRTYEGAISVESQLGQGATFRVFFPLSAQETLSSGEDDMIASELIEAAGLVLLVEDEPLVRHMAEAMLNFLGCEVICASDGFEGVEVFRERKAEVDLVLLDHTMPRMNGWETLKALRALQPDIPVILASGYDETKVMQGEHPEQPQAFLQKPYQLASLKAAISAAKRPRPERDKKLLKK